MATIAFLGKGAQLQVETATPGVFETIAEVRSISGPTLEGAEVDVTNMDSPGRFREFIPGLVDPGNLTFETNYNPSHATHQQILSDLASTATASVTRNYRLRFAQLSPIRGFSFAGFVQSAPINVPVDSQVSQNVTIRATGAITPFTE